MKNVLRLVVVVSSLVASANATLIGFEDLTTRNNFTAFGIVDSYQGYEWGYGLSGGVASRTFVNTAKGWASATVAAPAINPAPSGMGGTSYAWNWDGTQSLWIDFGGATDVSSIDLAVLSSAFGSNASSIQLFGYDTVDALVGSTDVLTLSSTFQTLTANLSSISYLEIRANDAKWFSVDNLVIGSVPEPATMGLMGLFAGGIWFVRRFFSA